LRDTDDYRGLPEWADHKSEAVSAARTPAELSAPPSSATVAAAVPAAGQGSIPPGAWVDAGGSFRYCPSCASSRLVSDRGRRWICPDCGFEYFHNVATAAGVILEIGGRILLLPRTREPMKGKLALPGGFVEPGERAEDAALRECREEIGWAPDHIEFLASYPNRYLYNGIPYATCDLYFFSQAPGLSPADLDPDPDEVGDLIFASTVDFPWKSVAFESAARALRRYLKLRNLD